jgi:acyl-CoA thioesterase YciA
MIEQYKSKSSFFVFDKDLNFSGTLFGGKLMAECDIECAKIGRQIVDEVGASNAVTRSFIMNFVASANKADLISMNAYVEKFGTTSVTIKVDCSKYLNKSTVYIGTAHAVFVILKDGVPFKHGLKNEN